jgi:hypothetical protein
MGEVGIIGVYGVEEWHWWWSWWWSSSLFREPVIEVSFTSTIINTPLQSRGSGSELKPGRNAGGLTLFYPCIGSWENEAWYSADSRQNRWDILAMN